MKRKWVSSMFLGIFLTVIILFVAGYGYLHTAKFGAFPTGARLEKIKNSPNYRDGEFRNTEPIPISTEKSSMLTQIVSYLSAKKDRPRPPSPVPTIKTNLMALDKNEDVVIWLGHSSFYLQLAGQSILIDPVLSEDAAPVPWVNEAFAGTNIYVASDFPKIDMLLITHDHWDHLDYPTMSALKDKITKVITPLGVGAHFERWGFPENSIIETDWHQSHPLDNELVIHTLPARHYSGRTLTRNKTLWAAYALVTPAHKIYISGDSGYGAHFQEAGNAFGGFDLAILDSGQYNERWRYVHMMPEDAAKAADDLKTKALLPAHIGKFSIAYHAWDEPFIRLTQAIPTTQENPFKLLTPKIGEPVRLTTDWHHFLPWWMDKTSKE